MNDEYEKVQEEVSELKMHISGVSSRVKRLEKQLKKLEKPAQFIPPKGWEIECRNTTHKEWTKTTSHGDLDPKGWLKCTPLCPWKYWRLIPGKTYDWEGGENPCPSGMFIVLFRSGGMYAFCESNDYRWEHIQEDGDIVKFIILPEDFKL